MSGGALKFKDIIIESMPGFKRRGFKVDELNPGINIIHGPNGSGKSTTARAIRSLLWPAKSDADAEVRATFELEGDEWNVELQNGRTLCRRNGTEVGAPLITPDEKRDSYYLPLPDLMTKDDKAFAEKIREEAAGGHNVAEAAKRLEYQGVQPRGEFKELKSAADELRKATAEQEKLKDDEGKLNELKRQLAEAEEAKARAEVLEKAVDYAQARDELQEAEEALKPFDARISKLLGNEHETLDDLKKQRTDAEKKKADAGEREREAQINIEEQKLPKEGVTKQSVDSLRTQQSDLQGWEQKKEAACELLVQSKAQRDAARKAINTDVADEQIRSMAVPENWSQVLELGRKAEDLRGWTSAQQELKSWFGALAGQPKADIENLDKPINLLYAWLDAGQEGASVLQSAGVKYATIISAVFAVIGIFTTAFLTIPLLAVMLYIVFAPKSNSSGRGSLQIDIERLACEKPSEWTLRGVRDLANKLRSERNRVDLRNQEIERANDVQKRDQDLTAKEETLARAP